VIIYPIGTSGQTLVFGTEVIARFKRYQQLRWWRREAGGQLFARFVNGTIHVIEATGPRPTDLRSRYSYEPDRAAEQREIDERFLLGLHFIGDWHTHPEDRPSPSGVDLRSTADGVRRSSHELNAFVLTIVGRVPLPEGLYVSLHDGNAQYVLHPNRRYKEVT
jgi:integrative and conjugative element protein (TIGR02256 family)